LLNSIDTLSTYDIDGASPTKHYLPVNKPSFTLRSDDVPGA